MLEGGETRATVRGVPDYALLTTLFHEMPGIDARTDHGQAATNQRQITLPTNYNVDERF